MAVLTLTLILPAIERNGQKIDDIAISAAPDKTIYLVGEEANYDGLRVTVTRKNGETFTVRAPQCQITGFDSSAAGSCINVKYEEFEAAFYIKVEDPPRLTPALKGITLETLPKTEYKLGEWLDTTNGVILCEYVDGSTSRLTLTNGDVYGFVDIDAPGEYELTVRYMENGIIAETTYTITVTE